jgi:hypothetical protein
MDNSMVGGTKIVKKQPQEQQMGPPPGMQQQMAQGQPGQQGHPGMQMGPGPQMSPQQMQQMQQMQMQQQAGMPMPVISKGSSFGKIDTSSKAFKYALLVILLFIILNSKIIWKQLSRLPFMGQVEPSMIALIANSVLAGFIFYMVVQFVLKMN